MQEPIDQLEEVLGRTIAELNRLSHDGHRFDVTT